MLLNCPCTGTDMVDLFSDLLEDLNCTCTRTDMVDLFRTSWRTSTVPVLSWYGRPALWPPGGPHLYLDGTDIVDLFSDLLENPICTCTGTWHGIPLSDLPEDPNCTCTGTDMVYISLTSRRTPTVHVRELILWTSYSDLLDNFN